MYEIAAVAATAAFAAAWFAGARNGRFARPVFTAMLMFAGAALMWGVDCVAELSAGEPFPGMDADGACLAAVILAAGLGVFAILCLTERNRAAAAED